MDYRAAEKRDKAKALADELRSHANLRSVYLTGYGPTASDHEVRDRHADAVAELAELIASLDFRQMA